MADKTKWIPLLSITNESFKSIGTLSSATDSVENDTGNYCDCYLSETVGSENKMYINFDYSSYLPSDCTIQSVESLKVKFHLYNYAKMETVYLQLYNGTTALGSPTNVAINNNTQTITVSLTGVSVPTRANIDNLRLLVYAKRNSTDTGSCSIEFMATTLIIGYTGGTEADPNRNQGTYCFPKTLTNGESDGTCKWSTCPTSVTKICDLPSTSDSTINDMYTFKDAEGTSLPSTNVMWIDYDFSSVTSLSAITDLTFYFVHKLYTSNPSTRLVSVKYEIYNGSTVIASLDCDKTTAGSRVIYSINIPVSKLPTPSTIANFRAKFTVVANYSRYNIEFSSASALINSTEVMFGYDQVVKFYVGSSQVSAIYLGDQRILF